MRALLFYMMAGVALSGPVAAQTLEGTDYVRLVEDELPDVLVETVKPDDAPVERTVDELEPVAVPAS